MKRFIQLAAGLLAMLLVTHAGAAPDKHIVHRSTAREAHALLTDAVKYFEDNGAERAFKAFSERKGKFVRKDLYVFVIDKQGVYRANGSAPDSLVGLNVLDARDAAGNTLFRDMLKAVETETEGQVHYVWLNRATNKVEPKTTFVHRIGDYVLGVGYYSPRSSESDAKKLLDDAVALVKAQGIGKAAKIFNSPKGKFVRDDLYVFAVNLGSGKFEAHGAHPKWTGTQASDLHDVEGHAIINDMMNVALKDGEGTVDYVWRNPVTNAVEKKRTFVRREGKTMVAVGFYREN